MIEAYFDLLTNTKTEESEVEISPLVESLCGVIELPEDFDYKDGKAKYLLEKYK